MTLDYHILQNYRHLQDDIVSEETPQAAALGKLLLDTFGPTSVIDIGCGPGIYLLQHKAQGCDVFGIDGCDTAGSFLDPSEFLLTDLREPFTPPKEYGLALCVEVAEHIEPEYADVLVDAVCRSAPIVFFSAARPNQGGCGHFNCQEKAYWLDKFSRRGFELDVETTQKLHAVIDTDPVYARCQWLRWNAMVVRRTETAATSARSQ